VELNNQRNPRIIVRWQDPVMGWWVCRIIQRPCQAYIDDLLRDGRTHIETALALLDDQERVEFSTRCGRQIVAQRYVGGKVVTCATDAPAITSKRTIILIRGDHNAESLLMPDADLARLTPFRKMFEQTAVEGIRSKPLV